MFERHENYDGCTFITSLVHSVTSHLYPETDWLPTLWALLDGTDDCLDAGEVRELAFALEPTDSNVLVEPVFWASVAGAAALVAGIGLSIFAFTTEVSAQLEGPFELSEI